MWLLRCLCLLLVLAGCGRIHGEADLMAAARQHIARGEAKSAVIQLKNVLQQTPSNRQARLLLGQLYLDMGDVQSADKELRRALELGVHPGDVLPALGKAMLQQGQYQKLLDEIEADEQQPELTSMRGHALLALNRVDDARAVFAQIALRHPGSPPALLGQARVALRGGDRPAAMDLVQQVLSRQPDNLDALRMQGDLQRMSGKNDEAAKTYRRIIALRPVQVQAHVDLANLLIQAGKPDDARKELNVARQIMPNSLQLIYTQALLEFQGGKLGLAQDYLAQVLRGAPDHLPSNLLMGAVLHAKASYPQAEQHLRKFLEAVPGHPYASKLLASTLMNSGDTAQALAIIEPLLPNQQQDVEMLSLAGELYLRQRQYAKSTDYFERASKLSPQAPMLRAALAMSHLGQGDNDRAVAELEQAVGMDSKSSRVATLLVLSQLRARQYDQALQTVNHMEVQFPNNPMVQNLKGGVLLMKRDNAGARAAFERSAALDPLFLPALDNLTNLDLQDKKPELARRRLEAAFAKDKNNVDIMTALAKLAITQRQLDVARSWLERAAQAQPDALEPSLRLANFYALNKELPKALTLAQKLLASHPADSNVVALAAGLQSRSGQGEAALDNWNKLAAMQPDSPEVLHQLAGARAQAHDNEGATQALNKALVLYQQAYERRPSAPLLLSLYGALIQAGKTAEARTRAQQWLAANPGDVITRLYFAASLLAQKDYPASTVQFEQVIKQAPDQFVALNNLAWLYQQKGDKRALDYAERAYRLAPNDPSISDTLAWVLVEQGQLSRAMPLLKQATAQAPANQEIRYHYGVALARSGDKKAARTQLEPLLAVKDYERRDAVKAVLAQ